MLLAIDIGNSAVKFGVFDGDKLSSKFSIPTKRDYSVDEIAREVNDRLPHAVDAAVICSVVPEIQNAMTGFVSESFKIKPRFVRSTDDLGLKANFSVATTGVDRSVNSSAAAEKYGVPCIVVSFGTATTIDVVSRDREYLGGLIAPGVTVSARALSLATSKLPEVEVRKPIGVIAQTTETAIQSGIVYGHIAMVQGLLRQVMTELGTRPKVIATGGSAELLAPEIDLIDIVDSDLSLAGLNLIYEKRPSQPG